MSKASHRTSGVVNFSKPIITDQPGRTCELKAAWLLWRLLKTAVREEIRPDIFSSREKPPQMGQNQPLGHDAQCEVNICMKAGLQ